MREGHRRLLTEGLVIVTSILLAFSIDAAWDSAQERRDREALAELIRADLDQNISALEAAEAQAAANVDRLRGLVTVMSGEESLPAVDSLGLLIGAAFTNVVFEPVTAAYDAAAGSDVWTGLPPSTRLRLAEFVRSALSLRQRNGDLQDDFRDATGILLRYGGLKQLVNSPGSDIFASVPAREELDARGLLADPDFEAWVVSLTISQYWNRDYFSKWRESLVQVRDDLAAI